MKKFYFLKYLISSLLLTCFFSNLAFSQVHNSASQTVRGNEREFIRVLAFSDNLVKFQACKFVEQDKAMCRNLGDGLYDLKDIDTLKSKVTQKFWLKTVSAVALAAGVATAAIVAAPTGAVMGTFLIYGLTGSESLIAAGAAVATVSAIYGAGYGAAVCPRRECLVAGATVGGALALTNSGAWLMTGSAFTVAPVAAGVLAARAFDAATDFSGDYKLMSKLSDFKTQIQNQQFRLSAPELEEVLKHLPPQVQQGDIDPSLNMGVKP